MITKPENRIKTAQQGFEKAEKEPYAFLWDVAVIGMTYLNVL